MPRGLEDSLNRDRAAHHSIDYLMEGGVEWRKEAADVLPCEVGNGHSCIDPYKH